MQNISLEISKPIFWEKLKKISSFCHLLNFSGELMVKLTVCMKYQILFLAEIRKILYSKMLSAYI